MKKSTLIILITLASNFSFAQTILDRFLSGMDTPIVSLDEYVEVKIKWDQKGEIQAEVNDGLNNLRDGNPQLALGSFQKAIGLDTKLWVAHYYEGIALKKLRRLIEADTAFAAAQKLNPEQAEIYLAAADVCLFQHKYDQAERKYKKAAALDPRLGQVYTGLAACAISKRDQRTALNYLKKCEQINPGFARAYLMEGVLVLLNKKPNEALVFFNKALAADSSYSETYFWRGVAFLAASKPAQCLSDWKTLTRFNPTNAYFHLEIGLLETNLELFDDAFSDLRKGLRGREVNDDYFGNGLTVIDKQIDFQNAVSYIASQGYGLKEESFKSLKKGFCLLLQGKNEKAMDALQEAETIQRSAPVLFIKALAYEHGGKTNLAYVYYEKSLLLDNDILDAHKKRGMYRFERKQWKGAHSDFDDMLRIQPGNATGYRFRGQVKANENDCVGAIADLTAALKYDSIDQIAREIRINCREHIGDNRGAAGDLLKLLKMKPADWMLVDRLVANYLILADTTRAVHFLDELMAINGPFVSKTRWATRWEPHILLATIYTDQRNRELAFKEIKVVENMLRPLVYKDPIATSQIDLLTGKFDYQESNYEKAIRKFSKALEKNPASLDALYFRAKAYRRTGQIKEALEDLAHLKSSKYLDSEQLYEGLSHK